MCLDVNEQIKLLSIGHIISIQASKTNNNIKALNSLILNYAKSHTSISFYYVFGLNEQNIKFIDIDNLYPFQLQKTTRPTYYAVNQFNSIMPKSHSHLLLCVWK